METPSNHSSTTKHEHATQDRGANKSSSPLDAVKKWIGLAAAVLSLGSAIYGVLSYQADKRARTREVTELLGASHTEQSGDDYAAAWKSLQSAIKIIDEEKGLVKLFGGLDKEQEQVHTAQEDLAMEWLRAVRVPEPGSFEAPKPAGVSDPVLGVLSAAAAQASGSRKADLLAHLGWGSCLKLMNHVPDQHPDKFFRQAVAIEADNPYAKTFWGYCMVTTVPVEHTAEMAVQAQPYFVAALSSRRALGPLRAWVRQRQFSTFHVAAWPKREASWWQAVNQMYGAKEPLETAGPLLTDLEGEYILHRDHETGIASIQKNLERVLNFAPIGEHVQLLHVLVDHTDPNARFNQIFDERLFRQIALATALEKAGKPTEALAVWRDAQSRKGGANTGDDDEHLSPAIDAAVARLSTAGTG